jgi:hypothetical protein
MNSLLEELQCSENIKVFVFTNYRIVSNDS